MTNWFPEALDVLYTLADLKENWDGAGELPITDEAISNAMRLLYRLSRRGVRRPYINPMRDGGVQLEWEGDDYLEIECHEKYKVYYHSAAGEGTCDLFDPLAFILEWLK